MAYIGNGPGVASQRILTTLTAVDGQTTFVPSAGYTLGYVDVFLNGVKLVDGTDYTAANGVNIVLTEAAALNDTVEVVTYFPRGLSDGYTKAEADGRYEPLDSAYTKVEADARYVEVSGDTVTGNLAVDGAFNVGGTGVTTYRPTVEVVDTTNGASLTLRGQSPTIFFDQTAGGSGTLLSDSGYIKMKDGSLDDQGQTFATFGRGFVYFDGGTDGDMVLKLRADSDNNNEYHNPYIVFAQDSDAEYSAIGHHSNNLGLTSDDNALFISNGASGGRGGGIVMTTRLSGASSLYTDTSEAFRLDASGRLTLPYQPCFAAYRSSSYNTASGDHEVDIDVATLNRGNHYSTTGNRFTAPLAGAYKFDTHISVYHSSATSLQTQDDSQYLTFKKNGVELGRNSGSQCTMLNSGYLSKAGVEHSVSFSVILQLAASDYVEVEYGDIQSAVTISNASFNGHLIG